MHRPVPILGKEWWLCVDGYRGNRHLQQQITEARVCRLRTSCSKVGAILLTLR